MNSQDFQSYTCNCLTEYTGSSCEVPVPCLVNGIIDCGVAGVCKNQPDYSDYYCECDGYHTGDNCEVEIVFPPGQDPNPTVIDDFFPCNWEDTFCIIYLQASIVLQGYNLPDVTYITKAEYDQQQFELWQQSQQRNKRQTTVLSDPPPNQAMDSIEQYGCWCSKLFTGVAQMGAVLDEVDALCRDFSRCWRCIGMMGCEGDLAEPYTLTFTPLTDNYSCSSTSECATNRCLCTANAAVILARHLIDNNSTLVSEFFNPDPSACVRGDGSVFNDQCCGNVPLWVPYNGLLETCVDNADGTHTVIDL